MHITVNNLRLRAMFTDYLGGLFNAPRVHQIKVIGTTLDALFRAVSLEVSTYIRTLGIDAGI